MNIAHSQTSQQIPFTQTPITFKPKLFYKILPLVIGYGPLFFFFIYFLNALPIFVRSIGTTTYLSDTPGLGLIAFGLVFVCVLVAFALVMLKVYDRSWLAFYDTYFEVWPHLTLLNPPLRVAYDEVLQLNPDLHGCISLMCISGKIHRVEASAYMGGPDSVINQFIAKLGPAVIRPNLFQQVKAWHWWDFVFYFAGAIVVISSVAVWSANFDLFRPQSLLGGWTSTAIFTSSETLELFALDQNNNPYVLLNNGDFTAHILRHSTAEGIKDLDLPASVGLKFPQKWWLIPLDMSG